MSALRPYFIQGRGGDDSYDPSVATAIVLGPSAQIVAFDMKMRDGMGVEPLCVCVLGGCGRLTVGCGQGCVSRTEDMSMMSQPHAPTPVESTTVS